MHLHQRPAILPWFLYFEWRPSFPISPRCSGGYFVNMLDLPIWLQWIRFTSFWYYVLGLW